MMWAEFSTFRMHKLHNSLPWRFTELSQSAPCFGFSMAYWSVPSSPLRFGHVWSCCARHWSSKACWIFWTVWVWAYRQNFVKSWYYISARCLRPSSWKRKFDKRVVHVCTLGVTSGKWVGLAARKIFRHAQESCRHFSPKWFCPGGITLDGNKVKSHTFFKTQLVYKYLSDFVSSPHFSIMYISKHIQKWIINDFTVKKHSE